MKVLTGLPTGVVLKSIDPAVGSGLKASNDGLLTCDCFTANNGC